MITTSSKANRGIKERFQRGLDNGISLAAQYLAIDYRVYFGEGDVPKWKGDLKKSLKVEPAADGGWDVIFDIEYASYVDKGTIEHWMPFFQGDNLTALGEWAQEKAPHLFKKGGGLKVNKAHPFVIAGIQRNKDMIKTLVMESIVEELNKP